MSLEDAGHRSRPEGTGRLDSAAGGARPPRLRLGRVARPHGLRGEIVVRETPLRADELRAVRELFLVRPDGRAAGRATVVSCREFGADLLVTLDGVADVEKAQELRGLWLEVERTAMPEAGPGRVYHYELLGLEVVNESGRTLGHVQRVLPTGAHEVLQVTGPAGEILIPYHAGTVLGWDPAARRLRVRLPAGLEEVYRRPESGRS